MPEQPPPSLVDLLSRLGLATPQAVRRVHGRVRRLARDLPIFESVWVDALAQARLITHYQAAQINAGRGDSLAIGPYVLMQPLATEGYGRFYSAQEIASGRQVRLVTVSAAADAIEEIQSQLERLVVRSREADSPHLATVDAYGIDGERVWAECRHLDGTTASSALVRHGRMPAAAVLEIARQMIAAMSALEAAGVLHGDVGAAGLVMAASGLTHMPMPGLRPILRREEGYAYADLPPSAYDTLAPERAEGGEPPSGPADLYACGCLWWQLLSGRPPFSGGNSLIKLRNTLSARPPSLRHLAPEAPAVLVEVIDECMRRDPQDRPKSFQALQARLGPATRSGKQALRDYLVGRSGGLVRRTVFGRATARRSTRRSWAGPSAIGAVVLMLVTWPLWRGAMEGPDALTKPSTAVAGKPAAPAGDASPLASSQYPVTRAAFETVADRSDARPTKLLPTDRTIRLDRLDLPPRCVVRGIDGDRVQIYVPPTGLAITAADVRFEKVDFVWNHAGAAVEKDEKHRAVVFLVADSAEFRQCSFQATQAVNDLPVAILWRSGGGRDPERDLISGRIKLVDCLLYRVGDGLDCRYVGALHVETTNTLHVGAGALVALDHFPRSDEPLVVAMNNTTIRGGLAVSCRYTAADALVGRLTIVANGCVFAPRSDVSLLRLIGAGSPRGLLRSIQWQGDGSLVTPSTALVTWQNHQGEHQVLDDGTIEIDGLVRSQVEFAGAASDVPKGSQAVRWQAPLRSIDPPGIDPKRLVAAGR